MRPIIVGAGPAGLTLGWLLRKLRPIILEKSSQIGGCHSVRRGPGGEFSEHGPRVYSSAYVTTAKLLREMGIEFNDLFVPYNFSPANIGGKTIAQLPFNEIFHLAVAYFWAAVRPGYYKSLSMRDFSRDFSSASIEYFDRLCRLTDGAGIENYSVYKFLQLVNQHFGYGFYQPRRPNDKGLFKVWGDALAREGVEIILGADVQKLLIENGKCVGVEVGTVGGVVRGGITVGSGITAGSGITVGSGITAGTVKYLSNTVILAIPPKRLVELCPEGSFVPGSGRSLRDWTVDNTYIDYITISYQWNRNLGIKSKWGFPTTEWGVASVVLSDYFEGGTTLISVGVTNVDAENGKGQTARGSSESELIEEVFRQLKIVYPGLPRYDTAIIGSRIGDETAYIEGAADPSHLPSSGTISGLYNAGAQNGESPYSFTSMETAVVNAAGLASKLGGEPFVTASQWTLNQWILIIILAIMVAWYIIGRVPEKMPVR